MVEIIRLKPGESGEKKVPSFQKKIFVGDKKFSSRREAAKFLNMTTTRFYSFFKKGQLPDGRIISTKEAYGEEINMQNNRV